MSIFSIRKKNKPQPQDETFAEPITGGNAYQVDKVLKAQVEIDKATIPTTLSSNVIDDITSSFRAYKYEFWQILNLHCNYFMNLMDFDIIGENDKQVQELYTKILKCFRYQWLYGNCGLYKLADKVIPVYEIKAIDDANGELQKIQLGLLNTIINGNELLENVNKDVWLTIKGDDENYCRLLGSVNGLGAIITWLPFVKQQTSLLKRIYTLSFCMNKKIMYSIKDNAFTKKELELFFNDDLPIIFKLDGLLGNDFSTETIGGMSDGVETAISYYNFFIKVYYELLGRRLNVDSKSERNVAAEIDASQSNYDVLQRDLIKHRTYFLNQITKLLGMSWVDNGKITQGDNEPDNKEQDNDRDKEF